MVCPNCGYPNQPSNRFCVRCGIDTAAHGAPAKRRRRRPRGPTLLRPLRRRAAEPVGRPLVSRRSAARAAAGHDAAASGRTRPAAGSTEPVAPPPPAAPPGYPQWGYGQCHPHPPYPPSGSWAPQSTNGLAVASLVLGIVGWLACGLGSVLAIIFGFVAQGQIRQSRAVRAAPGWQGQGSFSASSPWP